jgi:hypothetical protein
MPGIVGEAFGSISRPRNDIAVAVVVVCAEPV